MVKSLNQYLNQTKKVHRHPLYRRDYTFLIVFLLFIISVITRFIIGNYLKEIHVYYDELYYFTIANSLADGRGITVYNSANSFSKVIYSIALIPAFYFKKRSAQVSAIAFLNAFYASSTIFPVYLLAGRILNKRKYIIGVCALFLIMSDLTYTMTFMSENLFLPFATWIIYALYIIYDYKKNDYKSFLIMVLLGCGTAILYYCKDVALCIIPAIYVVSAQTVLAEIKNDKRKQVIFGEFLTICIITLSFLLTVFGIRFLISNSSSVTNSGIRAISVMNPAKSIRTGWIKALFFSTFHFLLSAALASGLFPLTIVGIYEKELDIPERKWYRFLCYLLLISAFVVSYVVTIREDTGLYVPRTHLRYICHIWIPLIIILFRVCENDVQRNNNRQWYILAAFGFTIIFFFRGVSDLSSVDMTALNYIKGFDTKNLFWFKFGVLFVLLLGYCLFLKSRQSALIIYCILFGGLQLYNNVLSIQTHKQYSVNQSEWESMAALENHVLQNGNKNYLLLGNSDNIDHIQHLLDMFMNYSNVYYMDMNTYEILQSEDGIDLTKTNLLTMKTNNPYDVDHIDYIIIKGDALLEKNFRDSLTVACQNKLASIVMVNNPEHLPNIKTIDNNEPGVFIMDGPMGVSDGPGYLFYGPYIALEKGTYDITFYYNYQGSGSEPQVIGFIDVNAFNITNEEYQKEEFNNNSGVIKIKNMKLNEDLAGFETRMYSYVEGISLDAIEIERK